MITETYKGRKIKAVKGRGNDFGYARLTVNGVDLGKYLGDEANALRSAKGTIDHADEVGVGSARYQDYWYAPGTYELCENGHAQEIDGLCGHSSCIERRPVTAPSPEPTTPRPAMKRINVTPKMVEALENTIEINGKRAMIMSHPKTQAALAARGLADEHGYLTDQGRFVARLVSVGDTPRAWSWDTLEAGTRTWLSDQKRHAETAKPKPVGDVMVPPADFRVAAPTLEDVEFDSDAADREEARRETSAVEYVSGDAFEVGDVVAYPGRVQAEVTRVGVDGGDLFGRPVKRMYCRAVDGSREGYVDYGPGGTIPRLVKPVTEYSVKIWYRSGAYEGVAHSPEELARKIYADAVKSDGVEFAELHGPSGKLVESKTPNEESPVTAEPEQPTENLFLAGLPLLHPEPLPPAPLNVSQHGEDLTAAYSAQDPADG